MLHKIGRLIFLALISQSFAAIELRKMSYTKLPYSYGNDDNPRPQYALFQSAAQQAAYHNSNRILYVASGNSEKLLHVISMDDPVSPKILFWHRFSDARDGVITDVVACEDTIAVTLTSYDIVSEGHVEFFVPATKLSTSLVKTGRISVGSYPKSAKFTSDCGRLVVANEGIPGMVNDQFKDPPAEIDILRRYLDGSYGTSRLNFATLTANAEEFVRNGVRYVYRGDHIAGLRNTLSDDLEPESVTISDDDRYAYVSLQENNAIAVINLASFPPKIEKLQSLKSKNWVSFDMDASDVNGVNLQRHNVHSFYQPGKLEYFTINNQPHLVSANTGKMKEIKAVNFIDGEPCKSALAESLIDPFIDKTLKQSLNDSTKLGNAFMSMFDGKNLNGLIEDIYLFGGRGFSLWNTTTLGLESDSGDEFEKKAAQTYPDTFNAECSNASMSPQQQADQLSITVGPGPTSLAVGHLNRTTPVVIIGTRSGMLYVYSMFGSSGIFESVHREGDIYEDWQTLYNDDRAGDGGITDIGLIEAAHSGRNIDLLYVIGEQTGSLSVYRFEVV